ncbi:hypothetical protein BKA56DRAFT_595948 [Ilyonectria sp. MPI-CAGE-AT-0026]|nr:hypothetical protein BKA56DRAFT_595948 [Ilyonectria sp. MPI-CAGE-AT-0026]
MTVGNGSCGIKLWTYQLPLIWFYLTLSLGRIMVLHIEMVLTTFMKRPPQFYAPIQHYDQWLLKITIGRIGIGFVTRCIFKSEGIVALYYIAATIALELKPYSPLPLRAWFFVCFYGSSYHDC